VYNHFRLICGILGVILLGVTIAWFGQYERQQRLQQLESTVKAIGTPATTEQLKGRLSESPPSGE
jgi:hypothetical protein